MARNIFLPTGTTQTVPTPIVSKNSPTEQD